MKEVWDSILKAVPPDIIPIALLLAAAFFGIYYYKGLRSYTDALNDRWFLSTAVMIISLSAVYWIQQPRSTPVETGKIIALLVPRFEDDEGRQIENLFTQQVQAAVHALQPKAVVVQTDSYVRDRETAALTVKAGTARAIVIQPRVIRVKDKMLICFSLLLRDQETTRPFPPVAIELERATLSELSNTIVTGLDPGPIQPGQDLLLTRLSAMEQRLDSMNSVLLRLTSANQSREVQAYQTKRAIVIGINEYKDNQLPRLAGAVNDARSIASYLRTAGFEVTLLVEAEATAIKVKQEIERAVATTANGDMLLFYYSGVSFRSTDAIRAASSASPSKDLFLPPADFSFDAIHESITLSGLIGQVGRVPGDTLIILDGCHGTFGISADASRRAEGSGSLQILSSTQDNEFASDSPAGGIFSQALLQLLANSNSVYPITTSEILARVMPDVIQASQNRQHPKLLTLAGVADITIAVPPARDPGGRAADRPNTQPTEQAPFGVQ
jgi:hypothetical protein